MVKAFVDTIIRFSQEVSLWFEEDQVSEVVFRFDVGHVHHHLHLPVRCLSFAEKLDESVQSQLVRHWLQLCSCW